MEVCGSENTESGFWCEENRRTGNAVTVKRLLSESVRGLVCRRRKESCEVRRRTEQGKEM